MKNTIHQSSLWIYLAVILLSLNGGYINAATIISFLHNAVGYVTGNIALSGTYLAKDDYMMFLSAILLVISFLIGAILSGLIIEDINYNKDYRYKANLILQLILVSISIVLIYYKQTYCQYLLAMAMGLQNAMTTHYGSALIRTTHMTGTTTDLGILVAYWIKKKKVKIWKIKLYSMLILFFLIGSILGGIIFTNFQEKSLFIPVLIYLIMIFLSKK
ncbi:MULTISPECIES: YoaK family protein [unclassified Francisella]|uniref:YoaK family protein n=1 Tax=unclassified Francisella TaxID=2610885 RepID=UPI002E35909F|nr:MULTISPECIES: YoaK family protein [unclassified Francisella]MED7820361.1 YoaK family protein [Francisella sp. 19S2-4]MED7831196.1 YoaK family protein [Francisella sp. 19S2-10]